MLQARPMPYEPTIEQLLARVTPHLHHAIDLARSGMTARQIARAVVDRRLIRLRRGWYIAGDRWDTADSVERHLAALVAARHESARPQVCSHRSAATLLGLPAWSSWLESVSRPRSSAPQRDPLTVHITAPRSSNGRSGPHIVRHRSTLGDGDLLRIAGFDCTSPERTILDLARTEPFIFAFAAAETMLRKLVRQGRSIDVEAWEAWRGRLLERIAQLPRGRGVVAARVIARIAGPRSDSVLESVSRLRLLQLGFDVEQQVPVPGPNGNTLFLDFRLTGLDVFGECDGKSKYTDPDLRGGSSADEVLYAEKRRHDWVTATTRMRGIRWGAADVLTAARFADRLRAFTVPVPGRPTLAYGGEVAAFLRRLP